MERERAELRLRKKPSIRHGKRENLNRAIPLKEKRK